MDNVLHSERLIQQNQKNLSCCYNLHRSSDSNHLLVLVATAWTHKKPQARQNRQDQLWSSHQSHLELWPWLYPLCTCCRLCQFRLERCLLQRLWNNCPSSSQWCPKRRLVFGFLPGSRQRFELRSQKHCRRQLRWRFQWVLGVARALW